MTTNSTLSTPSERLRTLLQEDPDSLNEDPTWKALALVHPFPAPMSPSLAATLISKTTEEGDIVLDPMAGSGTVPAAALALGRTCYAMDIDPLARMTIQLQCGSHSTETLATASKGVEARAREIRKDHTALDRRFNRDFDERTREFINLWFPVRVRRGLMALWDAVDEATPSAARLPLKIAFSRVIIAKTAGSSWAIDLPHTRPHRREDKHVPDPLEKFPQRVRELTARMKDRHETLNGAVLKLRGGDVRSLPYKDASVDFVLTSSPYANAIDYMRAHKFSLVWMGHSIPELAGIRSKMIGAERGLAEFKPELAWVEEHLPEVEPKSRVAVLRRFFDDMDTVVGELHRVLKPGGACVFVLGSSFVAGQVVDTPRLIAEIAEKRGFEHLDTVYRKVNPHRRSLPFPRARGKKAALGKRMDQEAIVALAR